MRLRDVLSAGAIAGGLFVSAVSASPVGPGQTIAETGGFELPSGPSIAQITRSVKITYTPVQPQFFEPQDITLSFVNEVFRDPVSKHLTFVFHASDLEQDFGFEEASKAIYGNFDGFTTDVFASAVLSSSLPTTVSRDMSGNITVEGDVGSHETESPIMVIKTNATDFDRNGSVHLLAEDELNLQEINSNFHSLGEATADFTIDSLFEPKESTAAIPLPPAVYGGLAMLAIIALPQLRRKRSPG